MGKFYAVYDCEGYEKYGAYNVGIVICELNNDNPVATYEYLIHDKIKSCYDMAVRLDKTEKQDRHKKMLKNAIYSALDNKYLIICQSSLDYAEEINKLIQKYDIEKIYAYNSSFDKKCHEKMLEDLPIKLIKNITWTDIRDKIFTIAHSEPYENFCKQNNFLTDKKRVSTKAETIYQFLSNNPTFKENHSSLLDALMETIILQKINQLNPIDKKYNWRDYKPLE